MPVLAMIRQVASTSSSRRSSWSTIFGTLALPPELSMCRILVIHLTDHLLSTTIENNPLVVSDAFGNPRLVISFFTTVGNHDYGFYWYFYLNGTIEFEAKATSLHQRLPRRRWDNTSQLAPGLGAPFHQHLSAPAWAWRSTGSPAPPAPSSALALLSTPRCCRCGGCILPGAPLARRGQPPRAVAEFADAGHGRAAGPAPAEVMLLWLSHRCVSGPGCPVRAAAFCGFRGPTVHRRPPAARMRQRSRRPGPSWPFPRRRERCQAAG